jgi:predicted MFS family arabinose efflux permease
MLRMTISPALAEIGKAFPAVSQESLMMMVVLPSLVAIIFGLLSGILSGFFKVKHILYAGLTIFLIGGVGPAFTNNYTIVLVCRVLLGVGTGLFLPFTGGLIASFFTGDERNQMIGFQSTSVGIGNIITSLLAGLLAAINWHLSFLIYAFALIAFFLVIRYLPEPEKVEKEKKSQMTVAHYFNKKVLWVCFGIFFYSVVYFSFFGYLAFVIDGDQLGDSKAAGLATMLMTLGGLIMGLVFGKVLKILRHYTMTVGLLINFAGFFTLAHTTNIIHIFVGSLLIGVGFGTIMPLATVILNDASSESAYNYSNALFMTFVNIGTAIAPKVLVTIGEYFGNPDGKFIFLFCSICLGIATLFTFIITLIPKKTCAVAT